MNLLDTSFRKNSKSQQVTKQYAPYLEAEWGLKNHWYPVLFSNELPDGSVKGVMIAGHEIALRRAKGKVHALSDRCLHRGVKLSAKPMCLTDETITCWYHGFTFGLADGTLKTIVASPTDELIGKVGIRTYPVEEVNGMIFCFVGDVDYDPIPPLSADLPIRITDDPNPVAYLLDENIYVRGIHRTGNANWRLAVENGFDPGHLLIHADNTIILAFDRFLPLGVRPTAPEAVEIIDVENGPKGIMNMYNTEHYEPVMANDVVGLKAQGTVPHYFRTSMYMPGVLLVEHWPRTSWAQYEWYIPVDNKRHEYWEVFVAHCNSPEERKELDFQFENLVLPLALQGFNDCDLFAREALQEFYECKDGWNNEVLCELDAVIVGWRKLASRFNRGIQENPNTDAE